VVTNTKIAQLNSNFNCKPLALPSGGIRGFSRLCCLNCPKCLLKAKTLDNYLLDCLDNLDTIDILDTLDRIDNYLFIKG
jgi:hypothetical protein